MLRFSNHRCAACSRNWNGETPVIVLCNELANGHNSGKRVGLFFLKKPLGTL